MKDFEETKSGNVASWESNVAEQSWHQPLLFPLADCANSTDVIDSCDCETCYVEAFNDGYGYGADDGLEEGLTAAIEEIENIMTEFEESQYSMDTVLHRLGEVVLSLQIMYPVKEEGIDEE